MHTMMTFLLVSRILAGTKPAAATPGPDLTLLWSLLAVVLGGLISALTTLFVSSRSNKQQLARDREAYAQQLARDQEAHRQQREQTELAHTQQKERERLAYARSLREAKRNRLRDAYKVMLLAANTYMYALQEMQVIREGETEETRDKRLSALLAEALTKMDDALVTVTLENVGDDVETAFWQMRGAFVSYRLQQGANKMYAGTYTQAEFNTEREKVTQGRDRLIALMREHLTETEKETPGGTDKEN